MIFKAECDVKKGDDIYICDKCETHTPQPYSIKDDENVYCEKCYDYQCGMGDLAAEAAMEREHEKNDLEFR